jgi:hypothetical protein
MGTFLDIGNIGGRRDGIDRYKAEELEAKAESFFYL